MVVAREADGDGKNACVSYAVRGAGEESAVARDTKEAFKRAAAFLRSRVASSLDMKRTPQLSFVFIGLIADEPLADLRSV